MSSGLHRPPGDFYIGPVHTAVDRAVITHGRADHADRRELTETVREVNPEGLWIIHGREDALVRWAELEGSKSKPLQLVGYEDEHD